MTITTDNNLDQQSTIKNSYHQEASDRNSTAVLEEQTQLHLLQNNQDEIKEKQHQHLLQQSQQEKKEPYIGHLQDAPSYMSENEFLLRGYRINFNTWKLVFKTLFMWHNDTINIWSHLIGVMIAIGFIFIEYNKEPINGLTKIPIYIFFAGAIVMFLSSASMHLMYCKSKETCQCVVKLDYTGIATCGIGNGLTFIYYALYCNPTMNITYNSFWLVCCFTLFVLSTISCFHQPKFKGIKVGLFVMISAGFFLPLAHVWYLHLSNSLGDYNPMGPLYYVVAYNIVLIIGVAIAFLFKFPENKWPNKFDYCGSSHQIWHCLVVVYFLLNYMGATLNYEQRANNLQCPAVECIQGECASFFNGFVDQTYFYNILGNFLT